MSRIRSCANTIIAYRYREFAQLNARIGFPGQPFTIGAEVFYASDDYTESPLGLRKYDDRRFAADFTWAINDGTSVYLQGGYEDQELANYNSETFGAADWNSQHQDRFNTLDAGVQIRQVRRQVRWRTSTCVTPRVRARSA